MPDYSEEQIAAANKFLSKITQYREKYENDHEKIWRTNKKEIVQEFLQDCDGIKPLYKYFLFEERGLTSKYPFYPFILLGWALLIVLPGLLVKQAIIPEDFEKFFLADLATTLAFVLVGTYLVFAIRNVESQVIRVVSLELYDRIPEKEYINYILDIREKLYTKNVFSFTFFAITGLAIFTLVVIHGMAHVIFFKEIGFWNSFYHYVGLYPELAEVNEQGFLITPLSFFTKLMFEIGWVILIITMVGLAFYVFHMFLIIGKIRQHNPIIDFYHPDNAAGFKSVSDLLIRVIQYGVILIISIQIFFISLSLLNLYSYSSIALLPSLDILVIIVISLVFGLVPIGAAFWVLTYPQKELQLMISEQKKEKFKVYSKHIQEFDENIPADEGLKNLDTSVATAILFMINSYDRIQAVKPFAYTTRMKTYLFTLLPFVTPVVSIIFRLLFP